MQHSPLQSGVLFGMRGSGRPRPHALLPTDRLHTLGLRPRAVGVAPEATASQATGQELCSELHTRGSSMPPGGASEECTGANQSNGPIRVVPDTRTGRHCHEEGSTAKSTASPECIGAGGGGDDDDSGDSDDHDVLYCGKVWRSKPPQVLSATHAFQGMLLKCSFFDSE